MVMGGPMTELEPRPACTERWTRDGRTCFVEVNGRGVVEISIELLSQMLDELGFVKEEVNQ